LLKARKASKSKRKGKMPLLTERKRKKIEKGSLPVFWQKKRKKSPQKPNLDRD